MAMYIKVYNIAVQYITVNKLSKSSWYIYTVHLRDFVYDPATKSR